MPAPILLRFVSPSSLSLRVALRLSILLSFRWHVPDLYAFAPLFNTFNSSSDLTAGPRL